MKMITRPALHCKEPCKGLLGFGDNESASGLRAP